MPLARGLLPLQTLDFIFVCTVCDNTFAREMHMVEHTRRNWLSDAPEGGEGGGNFFSEIGEGYYMIIHVKI